jgi:chromosome segregation ATPase
MNLRNCTQEQIAYYKRGREEAGSEENEELTSMVEERDATIADLSAQINAESDYQALQRDEIESLKQQLAAVTAQRDKLLEASKKVINELMGYTVWSHIDYEKILMPLIAAGGDK